MLDFDWLKLGWSWKDWKKEQEKLKEKGKKINEDIVSQTRMIGLVENDFQIQVQANQTQQERLEKTKELYQNRKIQFEQLILGMTHSQSMTHS